jgi:hypothetical protein
MPLQASAEYGRLTAKLNAVFAPSLVSSRGIGVRVDKVSACGSQGD